VSFIEWWNMRLASLQRPVATTSRQRMASLGPDRRTDHADLRVVELVDAGGVVREASWPDGTHWAAPPSVVSGTVVAKGTGAAVASAMVTLVGTADTVRTDSAGHFRIETVPGKYVVEATDTTLASFIAPRSQSVLVEIRRGGESPVRLEVTPKEKAVQDVCRGQTIPFGAGMVTGVVTFRGSTPPSDLRVQALFQRISENDFENVAQNISLDERKRFVVCGVPRDRKITLKLQAAGQVIADTTVIVPVRGFSHQVLWLVSR
jgi:hypothetical protein